MNEKRLKNIVNVITTAVRKEVDAEIKLLEEQLDEATVVDDESRLAYLMARKYNWDFNKIEEIIIRRALQIDNYNISKTARRMNMTYQALDRRISKFKIEFPRIHKK